MDAITKCLEEADPEKLVLCKAKLEQLQYGIDLIQRKIDEQEKGGYTATEARTAFKDAGQRRISERKNLDTKTPIVQRVKNKVNQLIQTKLG